MASKVFDKFNAIFHFLPKFQVTINAGRYNEIGLRNHNMGDGISMHVTLFITFSIRQIFQIQFFIFQNYKNNQIVSIKIVWNCVAFLFEISK